MTETLGGAVIQTRALAAAERALTQDVVQGVAQRVAARQSEQEFTQNLLGGQSSFTQIRGGTFSRNPGVTTGPNGSQTLAQIAAQIEAEVGLN